MNEKEKMRKMLTIEETVKLFGADPPEVIGPVRLDPLGMRVLATKVAERLTTKRGPSEPRRNLRRRLSKRRPAQ